MGLRWLLSERMVIPECRLGLWVTDPTRMAFLQTLGILRLNR